MLFHEAMFATLGFVIWTEYKIEMGISTMRSLVLALVLLMTSATLSWASSCADNLKAFDAALAAAQLEPDVKAQLQDMRAQAASLCAAGNEEEANDVLSEASAMLGDQ